MIIEKIEKKKAEFIEKTGKQPKFIYMSTSVVFQLDSQLGLTNETIVDTILGMKIKFVPGVTNKEILEITDVEIQ